MVHRRRVMLHEAPDIVHASAHPWESPMIEASGAFVAARRLLEPAAVANEHPRRRKVEAAPASQVAEASPEAGPRSAVKIELEGSRPRLPSAEEG